MFQCLYSEKMDTVEVKLSGGRAFEIDEFILTGKMHVVSLVDYKVII